MPVIAKKKIIVKKKNQMVIEEDGIEELLKASFDKSQKAIYPVFMKSIKEKIIQTFAVNTENKKNKLKKDIKEIAQKILNEITENEKIENAISKLSTIIEKTLNIFFEISIISEKSKNDINLFLDNLCKWCIGRLNDIISELVKENSNELSLLLFNEQINEKGDEENQEEYNDEFDFKESDLNKKENEKNQEKIEENKNINNKNINKHKKKA